MQKYLFETDEQKNEINVMSLEEFAVAAEGLPHRRNFMRSMADIEYCKIETFRECIQGTMCVPRHEENQLVRHRFGFYQKEGELFLVGEMDFLKTMLEKMDRKSYQEYTARQLLLLVLEQLLEEDVLYLQKQEACLAELEEKLLKKIPDHFYEMLIRYRKRFTLFHAYYEQLVNIGDIMQTAMKQEMQQDERMDWQLYAGRAERLHDHVEMLREYLVQIRELYQSLIDVQQSRLMSILAVVTTIFLPLTLIAGWYGMNFPNMPEFGWKYAYPVVIIVSIIIILLEIVYFKKKKML